jgi:methyl-accepting chemotaxis protein
LLLVFLVVQGCVLWSVCKQGTLAMQGLKNDGLPSLEHMASLQEGLAIYRLRSFELMFAQEKDRPAKSHETDAVHQKNLATLASLSRLYPDGQGRAYGVTLRTDLDDYVQTMGRIRALQGKDFEAAMKMLDQEVPAKVQRLNQAAEELRIFCTGVAAARTGLTVSSFTHIRQYVLWLGSLSVLFATVAAGLVMFNSSRIRRALSGLVASLSQGSDRLTGSATTVASASQSLAEGASRQAASLEETSSSLEEMATMTIRNSENARKANELAKQTRDAADKGANDMQSMSAAMEAIKVSSDDIAKIIKTIDEIAFQTNILALNAAVEAARAGETGMGFAVVADEVRNLAQRSAQAARETAVKIEGAIARTGQGVEISNKVGQALNDIVAKVRQVDELVAEVAGASREQTQGITQINAAVGEMDRVTQSNASSAEESASAAEELNAQAAHMKQSVAELLKLIGGQTRESRAVAGTRDEGNRSTSGLRPGMPVRAGVPTRAHPTEAFAVLARSHRASKIPLDGDSNDF